MTNIVIVLTAEVTFIVYVLLKQYAFKWLTYRILKSVVKENKKNPTFKCFLDDNQATRIRKTTGAILR